MGPAPGPTGQGPGGGIIIISENNDIDIVIDNFIFSNINMGNLNYTAIIIKNNNNVIVNNINDNIDINMDNIIVNDNIIPDINDNIIPDINDNIIPDINDNNFSIINITGPYTWALRAQGPRATCSYAAGARSSGAAARC